MLWKKISSKYVHENSWYKVRSDEVVRPDGSPGIYNVVETRGAVYIIALDDKLRFPLVKQSRYTTGIESYEIPAGGIDNEDSLAAAKRELKEEVGMTADNWTKLNALQASNGISSAMTDIYLATNLHTGIASIQPDEEITDIKKVSFAEANAMILAGDISCAQSIAAITTASLRVDKSVK